jgi:multidrug resistance protein MdtO
VLQGYSPASDLTVLRDRVVGIIIGNLWITIFFTTLWPVSVLHQVHDKWASALGQLGDLLVAKDKATATSIKAQICQKISEASALNARALFEWRFLSRRNQNDRLALEARHVEQLASAVFVVCRLKENTASPPPNEETDQLASQRLIALAKGTHPDASGGSVGPTPSTLLDRARKHLDEEIDHASRSI